MAIKRWIVFVILVTSFISGVLSLGTAFASEAETYEADHTPWSGYWWPFNNGELVWGYNGGDISPLGKYDQAIAGEKNGSAYWNGFDLYYDEDAVSWGGLCFAWAMASISEEEPVSRGVYNDTVFNVGDKKGLLTALYDGISYTTYSFTKPESFHAVLEEYIKEKKVGVVMNLGGEGSSYDETWNYPVYKYESSSYTFAGRTTFSTTIYFADDLVDPDYVGTAVKSRRYTYYFDIEDDVIIDSGWTAGSITKPPKNARVPYGDPKPRNSILRTDSVRAIAQKFDDQFIGNTSKETAQYLTNGDYTLLSLAEDYFTVDLKIGDNFNLTFDCEDDANSLLMIYSPANELVDHLYPGDDISFEPPVDGVYTLKVTADNYDLEPAYTLSSRLNLAWSSYLPGIPSGAWNAEVSIFSEEISPDNRVMLSLMEDGGKVRSSMKLDMDTVLKKGLLFSDLFPMDENSSHAMIKIDSDSRTSSAITVYNDNKSLMMGASQIRNSSLSTSVVFPYIAVGSSQWDTDLYLINASDSAETVRFTAYGSDGGVIMSKEQDILPDSLENINPSVLGMTSSSIVSIVASANSTLACLAGYASYTYSSVGIWDDCTALVKAFGDNDLSDTFYLSHVASNSEWYTGFVVANAGDADDELEITVYDSAGKTLGMYEMAIKARQTLRNELSGFVTDIDPAEIASLKVHSKNDAPLAVVANYMTKELNQLAGVEACPKENTVSRLVMPFTGNSQATHTGIGIMNCGTTGDTITVTLSDQNGNSVSTGSFYLEPGQRLAKSLWDLFGIADLQEQPWSVAIQSEGGTPLAGLFLSGSDELLAGGSID